MIALVAYWRDRSFDAYDALIEIERCAQHGASSEVIAHLARAALDASSPTTDHGDDCDQARAARR